MKTNKLFQQEVIEALSYEPSINASNIGVIAHDGIVTLTGTVSSYAEKAAAEHAAQRVSGVTAVAEEMTVDLPHLHRRNDQDIARAAVHALSWQVIVPEDAIKLTVENGWITLDGAVGFNYQRIAAYDAVRQLTGVLGVNNLIVVKPMVDATDLKAKIEGAFERAAELNADKITLKVIGNRVELSGNVGSRTERIEAEHAAWSAPGVWFVENNLHIEV